MIELQQLNRHFLMGQQKVIGLDNVDLSIQSGDYMAITGPSGSGKSTLLNMIGLLDKPDSGQYLWSDQAVHNLSDSQQAEIRGSRIGFIFQSFHLIARLSALENIMLPLILLNQEPQQRREKAIKLLKQLELLDRADHKPHELSGGERQRVAIARAMITEPKLLLADEPTGNLDSHSGLEVIHLLEQLNQSGVTLLVVSHDLNLANRARRHIQMLDGRIISDPQ